MYLSLSDKDLFRSSCPALCSRVCYLDNFVWGILPVIVSMIWTTTGRKLQWRKKKSLHSGLPAVTASCIKFITSKRDNNHSLLDNR